MVRRARPHLVDGSLVSELPVVKEVALLGRDKIVRAFGYSGLFCLSAVVYAQGALQTPARVPAFALTSSQQEISIQRETDPSRPFSVVGPRGAVLGQEDGAFEVWVFPWKVLSGLRISARINSYPVPIDVNAPSQMD